MLILHFIDLHGVVLYFLMQRFHFTVMLLVLFDLANFIFLLQLLLLLCFLR